MPLTLEDAEKLLAQQAAEIKEIKSAMETTRSEAEFTKLAKRLDEVVKRFDELHENYSQLTVKKPDEVHRCFWCA